MGCRDNAHIHLLGSGTAQPLKFLFLQDPQQFGLQFEWNIADLIEKKVPLSASSNRPGLRIIAPVNAPFSWPNSSLSSKPDGIAAQFTLMKGRSRRALRL